MANKKKRNGKSRKVAYVVWSGRKPGVYKTWSECRKQVDGFPGAKYKGFGSIKEAMRATAEGPYKGTKPLHRRKDTPDIDLIKELQKEIALLRERVDRLEANARSCNAHDYVDELW